MLTITIDIWTTIFTLRKYKNFVDIYTFLISLCAKFDTFKVWFCNIKYNAFEDKNKERKKDNAECMGKMRDGGPLSSHHMNDVPVIELYLRLSPPCSQIIILNLKIDTFNLWFAYTFCVLFSIIEMLIKIFQRPFSWSQLERNQSP